MATYEVSLVVEGAAEEVETHYNEGAAYAAADRLAEEVAGKELDREITWHVYVTPHYCRGDEDCVCISWMPDHRPYRSQLGAAIERESHERTRN